jgi:hypothetical protein
LSYSHSVPRRLIGLACHPRQLFNGLVMVWA